MRDIKFRFWDKDSKSMIAEPFTIWELLEEFRFAEGQALIENKKGDLVSFYLSENDHIEIMQYTGLKDKNGKEVYEGDIIYKDSHGMFEVEDNYDIFIVKYSEELCAFVCDYIVGTATMLHDNYKGFCDTLSGVNNLIDNASLFVAGNIYENPELLK